MPGTGDGCRKEIAVGEAARRSAGFTVQSTLRWKPVTSTTREAEAEGSEIQGLTGIWSVIKDSLVIQILSQKFERGLQAQLSGHGSGYTVLWWSAP